MVASRFQFEPHTIEVEQGDEVRLRLHSTDGPHGFSLPSFRVRTRIPENGDKVTVVFTADRAGRFEFVCSVYCGRGHRGMKGTLVVKAKAASLGGAGLRVASNDPAALLALAQEQEAQPEPPPASPPLPDEGPVVRPEVEPAVELAVANIPTTVAIPRGKWAFHMTHRFDRELGHGDFGDLVGDLFGFDGAASVGLELRYGLPFRTHLALHRTNDRTIEVSAQRELLGGADAPVRLAVRAGLEGRNNLKEEHSPSLTLVASRDLGRRATLYAAPAVAGHVELEEILGPARDETWALVAGLGARLRVREGLALVGEWSPRLAGFERAGGQEAVASIGIEKQVGGHAFQILAATTDIGTTTAQRARGRLGADGWYLGFNLTRLFY